MVAFSCSQVVVEKFLVEIAVEADLMASCGDFFYHIRIFVRHDARHEEGSLQAEAV